MLSSSAIFDENAGAQGARRAKEVKGLQPQKKAKTPFTAKRRALGDISNRNAELRGATKAPALRLFPEATKTPAVRGRSAKAKTEGKLRRERVFEEVEVPMGRLGGDGSPPPFVVALGMDEGELVRRLQEEERRRDLAELSPSPKELKMPVFEDLAECDVDFNIGAHAALEDSLSCAIDDLELALPDDLDDFDDLNIIDA